ncbi:MAG: branched-chain amino acid ABC transporter permease [Thermovirga sp.]|nr:branched-chain amino acid ABC transporter permease [Thermovirga sp.]
MSKSMLGSAERSSSSRQRFPLSAVGWLVLAIAGMAFPLVLMSPVALHLATLVLAYSITIVGINLLTGFSGQSSFAHSLFVATGAYTTAILVETFSWPFLATIPVVVAVTFLLGLLLGTPAARLRGLYLSIVTFAIGLLVPPIILRLEPWTGGANGFAITRQVISWAGLNSIQWKYYIALGLTALAFYLVRNIQRGGLGRALLTLHSNQLIATTLGIDFAKLRILVFALCGMFAGVSGSIIALMDEFIAPQSFTFMLSILLYIGAVIGGIESTIGALIGAMVLVILQYFTDQAALGWVGVFYGAVVIALTLIAPNGFTGLIKTVYASFSRLFYREASCEGTSDSD